MKYELLIVALILTVAGCQPSEQVSTPEHHIDTTNESTGIANKAAQRRALGARDALLQQLVRRLFEAMANGGPTAAIEVCSREALEISRSVGAEHGVEIGRTSFQLRNPANTPPEWAQSLVGQRHEEPSFVELPAGATGALLPIKLKSQCLTCHGSPEQIPAEVKATLAKLYPDDQATGFAEGDLRGWVWVVVPPKRTSAANTPDNAFAQFDRVYIPALALTKQEKAAPSQMAIGRLTQRWLQLRPRIEKSLASDEKWPSSVTEIDVAIATSARQIREGQLAEAHETLEVIRNLMMEARQRQEFPYPLDALSEFHTTMEEIVKPAMKYTPGTITDQDIERLRTLSVVADKQWVVVEATKFDLNLFGIDLSKAAQLKEFLVQERKAIDDLKNALNQEDVATIIQRARGLKPPFARAYMFFGDFPGGKPGQVDDAQGVQT
jgi:hypothetical protein